jgi:predicted nucleic acid-binding protein
MVLGCAVEGKVQYIVSGDNDLLVLKQFRDIQIVRASDFLGVLTKGTD